MDETDEVKFRTMLNNTLEGWKRDDDMKDFSYYFSHNYANKAEEWAACYRVKAGINTNMYVESFHKVLKYIYLKGKVNKRMDRCIYVLMKYSRDKAFDRILKLEKGKSTKRHTEIAKRHRSSMLLSYSQVSRHSHTQWIVSSNTKPRKYTVDKSVENERESCWLGCQSCRICIHSFSCTCPDSLLHASICKHICSLHEVRSFKFRDV